MLTINRIHSRRRPGFAYHQMLSLVNVKLKWVKDSILDSVVAGERDLKAAWELKDMIAADPCKCLPVHRLSKRRRQLGLVDIKVSSFMRRYPTLFQEFPQHDDLKVPWFRLTEKATELHHEELEALQDSEDALVERLCRLLMLTVDKTLPLQTMDQLKWDLGLPYLYTETLIPLYPQFFQFVQLQDGRTGLQLSIWDESIAISELQKSQPAVTSASAMCLAFPVKFTRGFGLKKKCMAWLRDWQALPYTSPYADPSGLDPRTDISEKRIVGVFHELLHLTVGKRTERKNLSNLRKPLQLPQKFTKVFERHPGIFYISQKCDTQTIILREAYEGQELSMKHPLTRVREKFTDMMREGRLAKSRGLYKKIKSTANDDEHEEGLDMSNSELESNESNESDCASEFGLLSE
ncbi:protein WHAT'S THIS FACTOR 9, mitochondrial-like [Aristolochia californica]|uniref:protein WHAT'S THIS FACTOR 9, mitochondrial-like n=1 Tax=Aristolochia californica TaxID=171875 RepID=UPI0035DC64F5